MANYANLLATIAANIYTNNNNEVTAAMVKSAVDAMVASLGAGYQFMGMATPATTPSNTDVKQFYIASEAGTYDDFLDAGSNPLVVSDGEVAVLKYDTAWVKENTGIDKLLYGYVKKEYSANLIDPAAVTNGKYITAGGNIVDAGSPGFCVTDYIEINASDIAIAGVTPASPYILPWVAYDENKVMTRYGAQPQSRECLYEWDGGNYPNDAYIRIGLAFGAGSPADGRANYGTEVIDVPFSDYAPVAELDARVSKLEDEISADHENVPYIPNNLYKVWNDMRANRQYVVRLGLSRLLSTGTHRAGVKFAENGEHFLPIVPSAISQKEESDLTFAVTDVEESVNVRASLASGGANAKPRILVIGDSVTFGYGADTNKVPATLPNEYWAFAKMFFEMDKVDNGTSGHDVLFTGINDGDFSLTYRGQTRQVRAKCTARAGAQLSDLFQEYWGPGTVEKNPFYDSISQTFSIAAYLEKYRTMDDAGVRLVSASADPHGETVTGSDGLSYQIGSLIDSQEKLAAYDVCEPTHIFVNLNHNTSSNFLTDATALVNAVKTELPSAVFAWLVIDSTGTAFPEDFPDYDPAMVEMNFLHTQNNNHFITFRDNLEDEANGVFLLGLNFIQPEAIDRPHVNLKINEAGNNFYISDPNISGSNYHPNNICHCDWGYELYAFIKWLIS